MHYLIVLLVSSLTAVVPAVLGAGLPWSIVAALFTGTLTFVWLRRRERMLAQRPAFTDGGWDGQFVIDTIETVVDLVD